MPTVFYLVRHGECHNPHDVIKSRLPGFPLTRKGIEQSRQSADKIEESVAAVYTSPLMRTLETAHIIAEIKGAPIFSSSKINEWWLKQWEGKTREELQLRHDWKVLRDWPTKARSGELFTDVAKRMFVFYHEICKKWEGKTVVAVSHADPIMALVLTLQKKPLDSLHKEKYYPEHGSVIKVIIVGNKVHIEL